jgi:pyruvate dehydrogenase E2 component (dihydrolipoamide acetyltransferase)
MAVDVVMPQMGESIAEGTIVRWIKKVGDSVDRDEPMFEISTDKVDAEIGAPVAGMVAEIRAKEGETVPVNSVVAVIALAGERLAAAPPVAAGPTPGQEGARPAPSGGATSGAVPAATTIEDVIRQRSSPLVRRLAKAHNIDLSQRRGSGAAGRVTKHDILAWIGSTDQEPPRSAAATPKEEAVRTPELRPGATEATVPMTAMRRRIAEHMLVSWRTSAHVHTVFEVDFGSIVRIRDAKKEEYERAGVKLTYMSFIIKAAVDALKAVPVLNASIEDDAVVYHQDVNIGVAVALDWGLIVPVIKRADEQDLAGLSRAVADLASRARSKQLKPDEVVGGTFTITNPGVWGALFGMPIINQPQAAILGVGTVKKRPVVIDDTIVIRPMAYLTLGFDHRLIDGAVADQFMARVKRTLEDWDPALA